MAELKIVENGSGSALLTPDQAAQYLQVKLSTVYTWSMRRVIPVCKLGKLNRYRKADLDKFIAGNMTEVRPQCL